MHQRRVLVTFNNLITAAITNNVFHHQPWSTNDWWLIAMTSMLQVWAVLIYSACNITPQWSTCIDSVILNISVLNPNFAYGSLVKILSTKWRQPHLLYQFQPFSVRGEMSLRNSSKSCCHRSACRIPWPGPKRISFDVLHVFLFIAITFSNILSV